MPETLKSIESSVGTGVDHLMQGLKTVGATALAIGAMMGPGVAEAAAQPAESPAPKISLELPHLPDLQDMPGSTLKVTDQQRQELEGSAVSISIESTVPGLAGTCTGNVTEYEGNEYVTTAAHCFGEATWVDDGLLGPMQGSTTALDFLKLEKPYKVTIRDQNYPVHRTIDGQRRTLYATPPPMAGIKGLTIGLRRGDDALLLPDITKAVPSARSRSFDEMVPLAYDPAIDPLVTGEHVALYSMPGFRAIGVTGTGLYAGRMVMPGEKRLVDVVVEHSRNENQDPCTGGASGSTALAADSHQLVGVSEGLGFGYGHHSDLFSHNLQTRSSARWAWRHYERRLGVNIPPSYDSFCFFDVSDQQTMPNLVGAFGIYATTHEHNGVGR